MEMTINGWTIVYSETVLAWDVLDHQGRLYRTFSTLADAQQFAARHETA